MTYQMVHHRDEKVEEEWRATCLHLHLHRTTPLESVTAPDDECEIVCSQLGVRGRRVGVGVASRGEDCAALDSRLQALLFECQALEFGEVVAVC